MTRRLCQRRRVQPPAAETAAATHRTAAVRASGGRPIPRQPRVASITWAAWAALAFAIRFLRRRQPTLAFALAWLPVTLLPVSNILPLRNLQAERYLYIPSAGFCLALALGLELLGRRLSTAALTGILAAYSVLTVARNRDYRDDLAYFTSVVASDPAIPRARMNLGRALEHRGLLNEAEGEYRAALALWPRFDRARTALAEILDDQGRSREAAEERERVRGEKARSSRGNRR